jgi:hypothetical protein
MNVSDLNDYPLCSYFLSEYRSKTNDPTNFPRDQFPKIFERYESLFDSALKVLGSTKEALKSRSEFNFDSGDAGNLEGGIAMLRVVLLLQAKGFHNIAVVKPVKNTSGADITCERNGHKVCVEVKAITKQSNGRGELLMEDQLTSKIFDVVSKARKQLEVSAASLNCTVKFLAWIVNWFDQSMYLNRNDYQYIVNQLEQEGSLKGVEGVWFVTKMGDVFAFLNEGGSCVDW